MSSWIKAALEYKEEVAVVMAGLGTIFSMVNAALTLLHHMSKKQLERDGQPQEESGEPKTKSATATAELILHLLLKPDEAEAVGGDLQERYSQKVERLGKRRAYIWLWGQVLRSIWPLLRRFFTAGGFLAAAEFIRKLLS